MIIIVCVLGSFGSNIASFNMLRNNIEFLNVRNNFDIIINQNGRTSNYIFPSFIMPAFSSLIQTPASQVSSPQILSDVGKYVETLNELKQNFGNEKKTKLKKHRTNRPRKSFLQMTVINCDGQEVSLNSVDFDTLKTLLTVKRTFLPPPPEIPGINHLHIVQTLETLLLHNLKVSVIGEFPYRLAAYYLSENAFFKCFFPKLDSETSKPKSRKMILKTEYAKLLKFIFAAFNSSRLLCFDQVFGHIGNVTEDKQPTFTCAGVLAFTIFPDDGEIC